MADTMIEATGHYRKPLRRSVATGAGLLFPDNRDATDYRHLQEGSADLYRLNANLHQQILARKIPLFPHLFLLKISVSMGFLSQGVAKKGPILLVNSLQGSRSTFSCESFGLDHRVGHFRPLRITCVAPKPPCSQWVRCLHLGHELLGWPTP